MRPEGQGDSVPPPLSGNRATGFRRSMAELGGLSVVDGRVPVGAVIAVFVGKGEGDMLFTVRAQELGG